MQIRAMDFIRRRIWLQMRGLVLFLIHELAMKYLRIDGKQIPENPDNWIKCQPRFFWIFRRLHSFRVFINPITVIRNVLIDSWIPRISAAETSGYNSNLDILFGNQRTTRIATASIPAPTISTKLMVQSYHCSCHVSIFSRALVTADDMQAGAP